MRIAGLAFVLCVVVACAEQAPIDPGAADASAVGVSEQALWGDDLDGDGVSEPWDNCPRVANPDQANTNLIGPGDACELSLVLNLGATNKFARFRSHRELVTQLAPLTLTNSPNLLDITASPSGATGHVADLTQRLGVRRSGESLLGAPTFSGTEVLRIALGNAAELGGSKADELHLRLSGLGTAVVRFYDGNTLVATKSVPVPALAFYAIDAGGAAFTRVELQASSGSLSLQGYGEAVMLRLRNATLTCPAGYVLSGQQCVDVDECASNAHGCDTLTTCTNTDGSFTCGECPGGYTGTGYSGCVDIDECATESDACSELVTCGNTAGAYQCGDCPSGYTGDGFTCTDVDECALGTAACSVLVTCNNTEGAYTCGTCPEGYAGDGVSCVDIDECATGNGGCDPLVACDNTPGDFACGACPSGYTGDGVSCLDIDECATGAAACSPLVTCGNTAGSYTCGECPSGYAGDGYTCLDVDECALGTAACSTLVTCENTVGGYTCGDCPAGYAGDGVSCVDIDECAANNGGCDALTTCANSAGGYTCGACPAGYAGDGFSGCVDIDECAAGTDDCDANAACNNSAGSYSCACNAGYEGNGATCEQVILCNGVPIEDFVPQATTCGLGACAATGVTSCLNGTVFDSCSPGAAAPTDDDCDNIDDDCDGTRDEHFVSTPTTCGVGACASVGATLCSSGHIVSTCLPGVPAPSDATCNNIDNDCNGQVDEDYVGTPTACGQIECPSFGTTQCVLGAVIDACVPVVVCEGACGDGLDGDGDGAVDCADSECTGASACTSAVGQPCEATADCASLGSEALCLTEVDNGVAGGYCTAACDASPGACPAGAQCLGGLCFLPCGPGAACGSGEQCFAIEGPGACIPVCANDDDCSGDSTCNTDTGFCEAPVCAGNDATCDGLDDDCDGNVDEDFASQFGGDVSCGGDSCYTVAAMTCVAGVVNDTCAAPAPECVQETACGDAADNDGDGFADCDDPDCEQMPACLADASPVAGTCGIDSDCRSVTGVAVCLAAPGGYCSSFCDEMDPSTCPNNATCSGGICMARCNPIDGAAACARPDHVCILEAGSYVCLPPP
jgi:Calcium-binding EGF domain/EGF domain